MPAPAALGPDPRAIHLGEPACDRETETSALRAIAATLEGLENELARRGLEPRPLVEHVQAELVVARLDAKRHRRLGRRELQRIVEQIHQSTFDLYRVDLHGRRSCVELGHDSLAPRAELVERARDEVVRSPELLIGRSDATAQAREVEEVADEPV